MTLYVVEGHDYGQHDVLGVYDTREAAEAEVARLSAAETREAYYCVSAHRLNVPTPQE